MKKRIATALLVGAALRLAALAGAGDAIETWAKDIAADGSLITATLSLELGKPPEVAEEAAETPPAESADSPEESAGQVLTTMRVVLPESAEQEQEEDAEIIATTISADADIKNDTGFDIDLAELAQEGLNLKLTQDQPQVLIIHTHSSEAYTQDEFGKYEASDTSRTEDKNYNVVRVGDELTAKLQEYGVNVIHDREIYDYPSYTGSYSRSGEAISNYIAQYPSIAIVIDLHRDALGNGDVVYKTKADISGKNCAQVMMLVGTGENGLYHPNWRENLKLALYMQNAMDNKYPTLARPIALKQERYNQHLTTGSMILEVGSSGNTLSEALLAIDLFADAVGPALAALIE
jgi:stage II sporulation protein P